MMFILFSAAVVLYLSGIRKLKKPRDIYDMIIGALFSAVGGVLAVIIPVAGVIS